MDALCEGPKVSLGRLLHRRLYCIGRDAGIVGSTLGMDDTDLVVEVAVQKRTRSSSGC